MIRRCPGTRAANVGSNFASWESASPMISNWRSTAERTSALAQYASKVSPPANSSMRPPASRASHKNARGSRRIEDLFRAIDLRTNVGVSHGSGHDEVHGAREHRLQFVLEAEVRIQ